MNSIGDVLDIGHVMRNVSSGMVMIISTLKKVASGLVYASGVTTSNSSTCRGRVGRVIGHRVRVICAIVPTKQKERLLLSLMGRLLDRLGSVFRNVCLVHSLSPGASTAVIDCKRHLSSVVITALVRKTI